MKKLKEISQKLLAIGLIIVILATLIATINQNDGGRVQLKQLSIVTDEGNVIKAVMYLPKGVSKENPAPGLLAVHGGNSSRYAMGNFAQEFARRGYVVISIDQSCNGQSDRGTNDYFGTEAAMKYLCSLEFVDQNRLCTMGHSMGTAVTGMAADNPQFGVKACINLGAGPTIDYETKVNLAVLVGIADENTGPRGNDTAVKGPGYYAYSAGLANAFGVTDGAPVQTGVEYGSVEAGNSRVFYQPNCGHLPILYSREAIALALDYAGEILGVSYSIPTDSQTWIVRELATAVAYIGIFVAVFGLMGVMLSKRKDVLLENAAEGHATPNALYWFGLAIMCVVPGISIQKLYSSGKNFLTSISQNVFAMEHINGVIFWMLTTALVVLAVNLILKKLDKSYDWQFDKGILKTDGKSLVKYLWIACCAFFLAYLVVYFAGFFGDVCIRLYNTEIHLFTRTRFRVFWAYLPLYLLYYAIIGYVQTSGLLCKGQSVLSQYLRTMVVSVLAPAVVLAIWYGSCMITGVNYLFQWRFVLGVLLSFLPGMAVGALIQVYGYRHTGKIWLGAFVNSILFSWMATSIGVMLTTV